MIRLMLTCILTVILPLEFCFAQDINATTEDGRKVVLKKDGTYSLVEQPKNSSKNSASYQKPAKSSAVFRPRGDRFLIWYDPSVWREDKPLDPEKHSFTHKDGDVKVIVLAERLEMSLEALKQMALNYARKAAPDVQVIFEENRLVNGKNVLCMKFQGTGEGIKFIFYGYYYAGKAGVAQVVTFTSPSLFSEYESDMTNFLNGLVINE